MSRLGVRERFIRMTSRIAVGAAASAGSSATAVPCFLDDLPAGAICKKAAQFPKYVRGVQRSTSGLADVEEGRDLLRQSGGQFVAVGFL